MKHEWVVPAFLLGSRWAIRALMMKPGLLPLGAVLVLSAGVARSYDDADLLVHPDRLLAPFIASLITCTSLFLLFRALARMRGVTLGWLFYRRLLAVYWLTAPLAWLYAVPYEQFTTPLNAVRMNALTLAVVSVWRVVLITRVFAVALRAGFWPVFWWVATFGAAALFVGSMFMPAPIFNPMGGLRLPPHEQFAQNLKLATMFWSCVLFLPLLLTASIASAWFRPRQPRLTSRMRAPSAWFAAVSACVLAVALGPALLWAQPKQQRRHHVETLVLERRYDEAAAYLAASQPEDYPAGWDVPPRIGWPGEPRLEIELLEAVRAHTPTPDSWVLQRYMLKAHRAVDSPPWAAHGGSSHDAILITWLLAHDHSLSDEQKEKLQRSKVALESSEIESENP